LAVLFTSPFQRQCELFFGSFGQAVSGETIFFKLANQKQELPVATMFVSGSGQNEHLPKAV
jgi:hypothetical protein